MNLEKALQELDQLQKKLYAYSCADNALYLDGVTVAPKDTWEGRGLALSILAGERQKLIQAEETGNLLKFLNEQKEELEPVVRRCVQLLTKEYDRMVQIPAEEYMEYAKLTNDASNIWHTAKEENDFELFRPYLERLVDFNRKFAGYYDKEKKTYDALLDEYEGGTDMKYFDAFFAAVKEKLVPLIQAIGEAEQIDDSFVYRHYPIEAQRRFSDYLMEVLGMDRSHSTIGETEHPFTLNFNNKDVRITTNYKEDNVVDSMYSVIHEGGHGLYELGIADELQYTYAANGVSMGIHESQSRFYENIIGRSKEFVTFIFPKMQEIFPEQLGDVTAEQMYRAVNRVQPSLIRTEADEVTYSLHVMIRYEIEKKLFDGSLEVRDIPETWNRLYKEYLGVDVPDDTRGCLQDSHWSGGMFGYFPSYALGSAYGAQMLCCMEKDVDVWGTVAKGDLSAITEWMKDHVHKYGRMLEPADLIRQICGEFTPDAYVEYLTKKYSEIYQL